MDEALLGMGAPCEEENPPPCLPVMELRSWGRGFTVYRKRSPAVLATLNFTKDLVLEGGKEGKPEPKQRNF